jgi:hypothetical protein
MSDLIRQSATGYKGMVALKFSQSDPACRIVNYYKAQNATEGGICAALSCYWIIEHADGGSLWDQLCDIDGAGGITRLKNEYAMGIVELQRGLMLHTQDIRTFMRSRGLEPHTDQEFAGSLRGMLDPGTTNVLTDRAVTTAASEDGTLNCTRFVLGLCDISTKEAYLLIKFGEGGWPQRGHACAAWVSTIGEQTVVLYFDPNYGEFYFENRGDFENWAARYLVYSGYYKKYPTVTASQFGKLYRPPIRR